MYVYTTYSYIPTKAIILIKKNDNIPSHLSAIRLWRSTARTQRNLFETLLNQTEIRKYLPFSD